MNELLSNPAGAETKDNRKSGFLATAITAVIGLCIAAIFIAGTVKLVLWILGLS